MIKRPKQQEEQLLSLTDSDIVKKADSKTISAMILDLCEYWEENLKNIYMKGVDSAPDWKEYEHKIWTMGEQLRLLLKKERIGVVNAKFLTLWLLFCLTNDMEKEGKLLLFCLEILEGKNIKNHYQKQLMTQKFVDIP